MAAFYKTLPAKLSWSGIKIMPFSEAQKLLPKPKILGSKQTNGSFYFVDRRQCDRQDIVVKITRGIDPLVTSYRDSPELIEEARQQITESEMEMLRSLSPGPFDRVLNAYLRANIDAIHFDKLCEAVAKEHMVQQSMMLAWFETEGGDIGWAQILLQPFVRGKMLSSLFVANSFSWEQSEQETKPKLWNRRHIPKFSNQIEYFMENELIDMNPKNFICTPDGRLVYIDYQPILSPLSNVSFREKMSAVLENWGQRPILRVSPVQI